MPSSCFCGCGRPVRLRSRKLNKEGETLTQLLIGIHGLVLPKLDPEPGLTAAERQEVEQARRNMESFADDGTRFRSGLAEALHDGAGVRGFDHPRMLAWIATALDLNEQAMREG